MSAKHTPLAQMLETLEHNREVARRALLQWAKLANKSGTTGSRVFERYAEHSTKGDDVAEEMRALLATIDGAV